MRITISDDLWICDFGIGRCPTRRPFPSPVGGLLSVQAISWVIEHSEHKLGNLIVLFMVANHAHADGTGSWPSLSTLARESRMSERNVRYCLRKLEKSGELITKVGAGPNGSNLYSIPGVMGAKFAGGEGQNHAKSVLEIAPEPSFNRPKPKRYVNPEIMIGSGPSNDPNVVVRVRPGYLEKLRQRDEARKQAHGPHRQGQ